MRYTNVYSFMSTPVTTDRRSHRRRPSRPSLPVRRPALVLWMSVAVILLAFALRIANIRAAGNGNPYYTAAVQSMLLSPTNLLYAAAEPGGSVSLDKPPLGFWIQALSVVALGRSGFAVIWPQIIAGVLSVAVATRLTRKHFGASAGLMAGATLAVLPVSVAVDRNNTVDSLLILTLLLAAGCFLTATTRARMGWPWLIAGALCIGAAFNIKMLQALLPVPAFFALYFLGNPTRWPRKLIALAAVIVITGAASLSWAALVDATPPENRPYVGSTTTNSAMELITGHNGLARLFGPANRPNGVLLSGVNARPAPPPPLGGLPPELDVGRPGLLRFFELPLAKEITWLLPLAVVSPGLLVWRGRRADRRWLPLSSRHQAVVLWGGWLLAGWIFFSLAGFMHAYYVAMLAPPLAMLAGAGIVELWRVYREHGWPGWLIVEIAAALTLAAQWSILVQVSSSPLAWLASLLVFMVSIGLLALGLWRPSHVPDTWQRRALAGVAVSVLLMPTAWSALTAADPRPDVRLPSAYAGDTGFGEMRRAMSQRPVGHANPVLLLLYIEPRTFDVDYVLAVPDANAGANFVLATRRSVLYIGGFLGTDPIVSAEDLKQMVNAGRLRYVWDAGERLRLLKPDIAEWLDEACKIVPVEDLKQAGAPDTPGSPLYECR